MKTSDIVQELLDADALTSEIAGIYFVHEDDLDYLVNTIRGIIANKLREEFDIGDEIWKGYND